MKTAKRERVGGADKQQRASIYHYRMLHGISQTDMAQQLDIDPVTLWRYENFKSCPRGAMRKAIAKLLGKTVGQVVDEYAGRID